MLAMTVLPEVTQGGEEPASSRVVLTLAGVAALAFMIMFSVLYPDQQFPGLGDILPLFSELGGSLIWFFILGVILGIGMLFATLLGELVAD
tara:strand:- start:33 stop:305 length:273 start_codon:yes stop_codon:yes gene_type:complete